MHTDVFVGARYAYVVSFTFHLFCNVALISTSYDGLGMFLDLKFTFTSTRCKRYTVTSLRLHVLCVLADLQQKAVVITSITATAPQSLSPGTCLPVVFV